MIYLCDFFLYGGGGKHDFNKRRKEVVSKLGSCICHYKSLFLILIQPLVFRFMLRTVYVLPYLAAMHSTSTSTPLGRAFTATAERAG